MTRVARLNKQALFAKLGYVPHEGQQSIHDSRAPRRIVACGVRFGKSLCAAMECVAAAMEPGEHRTGWVVAPTYDLCERVFNQVVLTVASHLRHRIVKLSEHERRLVVRNMGGGLSEVRGKSADNPVSLLGEGLDFLVVDEAARMKPAIWENHLSQRLIDKQGWALLISTPRGKGYFYDLWRRGQGADAAFASWNLPSWSNPRLARAMIDAERARLPERVFRQEYGGEFVEGSGSVFRYVREAATGSWKEPVKDVTYFAGLDLARVEDYTVQTVLTKQGELVFADRFHRQDWQVQVNRVRAASERYRRPLMHVDSTGVGDPILETLRAAGCRVQAYPFTQASKAALVNNLALLLEQRRLVLPRPELWPVGIDELEAFEYSVSDSGNVRTSAPGGQHDDCVMSLALAAWALRPGQPTPSIIVLDEYGNPV